jgi:excisionase family DNA binding protein
MDENRKNCSPGISADVLTLAETAVMLKCSRKTIYRYASAGFLGVKIGGQYRFKKEDIENVLITGLPRLRSLKRSFPMCTKQIEIKPHKKVYVWDQKEQNEQK